MDHTKTIARQTFMDMKFKKKVYSILRKNSRGKTVTIR